MLGFVFAFLLGSGLVFANMVYSVCVRKCTVH